MAYFRDLTPYIYFLNAPMRGTILNVGWLDAGQPFETGELPGPWLDRLWGYCEVCVTPTRGLHRCPFCEPTSMGLDEYIREHGGKRLLLGSAEIRAFSSDGRIFAAPNLIFHYVEAHKYRPPEAFVEAVALLPASEAYRERLTAYGMDWSENSDR